jgi:hypothetical protein
MHAHVTAEDDDVRRIHGWELVRFVEMMIPEGNMEIHKDRLKIPGGFSGTVLQYGDIDHSGIPHVNPVL